MAAFKDSRRVMLQNPGLVSGVILFFRSVMYGFHISTADKLLEQDRVPASGRWLQGASGEWLGA